MKVSFGHFLMMEEDNQILLEIWETFLEEVTRQKGGEMVAGLGGKECGQKIQTAGGMRRQSGKASWRSGPGADKGTVCAKAGHGSLGEDGGGGWAGCPGSWQAAGFGWGGGGGERRRELGSGEPLLRFSWALGLGGPVTSAPSWTGLQLIFAEHTLCGGPGRALSLPTTPSEGGAAIVAIFQMGKQARKS
ncbi:uncharacterized protein LOC123332253 isoform X3 [Bubalus bubalis]|uniref:uncharacterized protein LOC123332253 isoform X3 n=1 Tax=Bubalus bubalis TaxID=89462 RepID=UPI001E1B864A|nr:uncharacterized protein LOC123332253 isoform X3 [Bubalus bubalis]